MPLAERGPLNPGLVWLKLSTRLATLTGVSLVELRGRTRTARVSEARRMICYLMRTQTGLSLDGIGSYLGGRDHTTVLYSVNTVGALIRRGDAKTIALRDACLGVEPEEFKVEQRLTIEVVEGRPVVRGFCRLLDGSTWEIECPMTQAFLPSV